MPKRSSSSADALPGPPRTPMGDPPKAARSQETVGEGSVGREEEEEETASDEEGRTSERERRLEEEEIRENREDGEGTVHSFNFMC